MVNGKFLLVLPLAVTPERPGIRIFMKKHVLLLICNNIHVKKEEKVENIFGY